MTTPETFNIGAQAGTNIARGISGGLQKRKDLSTLDQVLSDVMQSNDPNVLNNSIGQILSQVSPERQPAALQAIQNRMGQIKQQQQASALGQSLGLQGPQLEAFGNLSPAGQELYVKQQIEGQKLQQQKELQQLKDLPKLQEEAKKKQQAQEVFNDQADLIKSKYIGISGKILPMNILPSAREERGRFTGNNAIFLEKLIPALNKGSLSEGHYKKIAEFLPKIHESQATQRGKLAALGKMMGVDIAGLGPQYQKLGDKYMKKLGPAVVQSVEKAFQESGIEETENQPTATDSFGNKLILKNGKWEPLQ